MHLEWEWSLGKPRFGNFLSFFPLYHKNPKFQDLGSPLPLSTAKLAIVSPSFILVQLHWIQQDRPAGSWVAMPRNPIYSFKGSLLLMLVDMVDGEQQLSPSEG